MRFTTALLLLGSALLPSILAQNTTSLPACVQLCITVKESEAGTLAPGATNIYQYCQSQNFIAAYQNCLTDNCNSTDAAAGVQIGQQICAAATSSFIAESSSIAGAASSSAAGATSTFSSVSAGSTSSSIAASSSMAANMSSSAASNSSAAAGSSSGVASVTANSSLASAIASESSLLAATASGASASAASALSSLMAAATSAASSAAAAATSSHSSGLKVDVPALPLMGLALSVLAMAGGALLL